MGFVAGRPNSMVISIASQKGGVGKTSTAISLAAGLAHRGHKVLLIDMDSQANSSKVLMHDYSDLRREETVFCTMLNREPLPVHSSEIPNLSVVPSHILTSNTDIELTVARDHREARLRNQLDTIKHEYTYVFIDCPPTLSWLTLNALTASDSVMVIVGPGYFELDSIVQLSKVIEETREFFNPELELLGYLFTMSDPTINSRTSLKLLEADLSGQADSTVIPRNTDLRDAHFNREDIFTYRPESKSAQAYRKLIEEVFHE